MIEDVIFDLRFMDMHFCSVYAKNTQTFFLSFLSLETDKITSVTNMSSFYRMLFLQFCLFCFSFLCKKFIKTYLQKKPFTELNILLNFPSFSFTIFAVHLSVRKTITLMYSLYAYYAYTYFHCSSTFRSYTRKAYAPNTSNRHKEENFKNYFDQLLWVTHT